MLKKLLVLVLILVFAVLVAALVKADNLASNGVISEERVINLPEDSGKWFISIVGNRDNRQYNVLLNWFESSAKLNRVKVQVHFWRVDSDSPLYQRRFASSIKGLPTVRVQKPDGIVVYQASGNAIPTSAEGLYGAMADAINSQRGSKQCPDGRCPLRPNRPRPEPTPAPQPQPDPEPQPIDVDVTPVIPDTTPTVTPESPVVEPAANSGISTLVILGIAAVCVVVGGALGLVIQWKKTYNL